jgi:isoamylase
LLHTWIFCTFENKLIVNDKKMEVNPLPDACGKSFPIGSTLDETGVNFCLFSRNCTSVDLLLFNDIDDISPSRVINLNPLRNRTYHYWHVFVPGISKGQLYGYKVTGPFGKSSGHRFDPDKVLLDPYSRAVAIPESYDRKLFGLPGSPEAPSMKSVVVNMSEYDWNDDRHPRNSFAKTVIYEMHIEGITKNPNSGLSPEKRGTYSGLVEKIPYLKELGITAVELLPVFQFDMQDSPTGVNFWDIAPYLFLLRIWDMG